jgi:glycosyltransferase involved in cell wall biosynthesis
MKICQVTQCFPYQEHLSGEVIEKKYPVGGVSLHVYSICVELAKLGHQVTIVTTESLQHKKLHELSLPDIDIKRVPRGITLYNSSLPLSVLGYLKPKEYDVIHAHTPLPAIAELAALRNARAGRPFIVTYHNDITKNGFPGALISAAYNYSIGAFVLRHADVIITTTRGYAERAPRLQKYLHKVRVAPNGISLERFQTTLSPDGIRARHGLGQGDRVILFVGALEPYKGCDYLVRSLPLIAEKVPQARLVMTSRGAIEDKLKAMAQQLNIADKVIFTGYVPQRDLPSYYAACDLFTLPSVSPLEGFGIVQLEAMACGKPVVTTTIPGPSEVDAEELATIHVPPRDIEALADAISRLLNDKALAKKMGENGRRLVAEKYTWSKIAIDLLEIYKSVLAAKRGRIPQTMVNGA